MPHLQTTIDKDGEAVPLRRMLSLDGGGIRGAATARFLLRLELQLRDDGVLEDHESLLDVFDGFAGTSTGGILAAALCKGGCSAEMLSETIYTLPVAQRIMPQPSWWRSYARSWLPDMVRKMMG